MRPSGLGVLGFGFFGGLEFFFGGVLFIFRFKVEGVGFWSFGICRGQGSVIQCCRSRWYNV